jgi:hypothetical protein
MIQITLKAKYHALIIAMIQGWEDVSKINYLNQVAEAVGETFDPEQEITVNVEESLIEYCYMTLGSHSERLVAADNREIKAALLPQLADNPDLLQKIIDITTENANQTEELRQVGIDRILQINL